MASAERPPAQSLIEQLLEDPYRFDFCVAVRRMECAHPDRPRVGTSRHDKEDVVRFAQKPSLIFAPAPIAGCRIGTDGRPELSVYFHGLFGTNGPMPLHFTEYVHERKLHDHDNTLAAFLDVFHNRLIGLFYRAWTIARPEIARDRPTDDSFLREVLSLAGSGSPGLRDRDAVPDEARAYYSGHLARQTRNADGLHDILEDDLGVPTEIEEFVGHWVRLPVESTWRLGASPETGALGTTSIVGERFWDRQQKFRIVLGPLGYEDFERFLPTGRSHRRLVDWVRTYVGFQLAWDVQLILQREEVPDVELGQTGRLGWTTWLGGPSEGRDADDLCLQPEAA